MAIGSTGRVIKISWSGVMTALAVCVFFYLVARFLAFQLPGVTRHGDKNWAFILHVIGGSVVLVLGPFQFIATIRNSFRKYHRWAGYAFVAGTLAAFIGFWALQPVQRDIFRASQATAISLWFLAMVAAVLAARRKRLLTHQHNMARAFVIAAYFVVVRIMDPWAMDMIEPWLSKSKDAALAHSDWIAWIVPLLAVELYYGRKWDDLLKRRERVT
jgi:uncharacterized membrane protein YozB (DUF420 family)